MAQCIEGIDRYQPLLLLPTAVDDCISPDSL